MAKKEDINIDDFFDDDFDRLPCSWKYVRVCLLLPALNGLLNAFLFPAYSLYFEEMDWPLVEAGVAVSTGFLTRIFTQQLQLRTGYWMIVPLSVIHVAVVVLALSFQSNKWLISLQLVVWIGMDPTPAIEGIAFDSFCDSEVQARQATSTVLSIFTICFACSCVLGGVIYDLFGWTGMALYHIIVQGLMTVSLAVEPACIHSFKAVFFPQDLVEADSPERDDELFTVVPKPKETAALPGTVEELQIEDAETEEQTQLEPNETALKSTDMVPVGNDPANGEGSVTGCDSGSRVQLVRHSGSSIRKSRKSHRNTAVSVETDDSRDSSDSKTLERLKNVQRRSAVKPPLASRSSAASDRRSKVSRLTRGTNHTSSNKSGLTTLSQSGVHFQNHFATSQALLPQILGATGREKVLREEVNTVNETYEVVKVETTQGSGIPKDVRLPAFCIVLNCFCNNCCYNLEYATFAIFFKQVHNWNNATFAGVTQMAGDVLGAIMMQVIGALFSDDYNPDELGCFRRYCHYLLSKPYTLSITLSTWVLFNLGMVSSFLPLAITAQIFMGTTFVYSNKWSTDMNLYYSLGDSKVFLSLQVLCRNADAVGGSIAGVLATWLYSLDPGAPFMFGTAMSFVVLLIYTVGFCTRLGFGTDIETAEEKRSRRLGLKRVSSWKSVRRTTQMQSAVGEDP